MSSPVPAEPPETPARTSPDALGSPEGVQEGADTGEGVSEAHSDAERKHLASVIAHPKMADPKWMDRDACDRCSSMLDAADAVLAAGYVRVQGDDQTVERLAEVLAKADGWFPWVQPADVGQEVAVVDDVKAGFRSMACAALAALRGGA